MEEKSWVAEYSRELDKKKRKEILDAAIEAEGMTPEAEVRSAMSTALRVAGVGFSASTRSASRGSW